jgi:hypothetical protein
MKPPATTVLQGGRRKAYRPIPTAARRAALEAALAAYDRGDYFEAHELLEPAWMGTDDIAERDLYQGLIKVAAAFVHGARGNPKGIATNLIGARDRLAGALGGRARHGGIEVAQLVDDVDVLIARLGDDPEDGSLDAPTIRRRDS